MALLGLGSSQGFSERPLKKVGMASKKLDFQLVWVLSGGWKKRVSTWLHFWVLAQSGSLAQHVRVQGPTVLLSPWQSQGVPAGPGTVHRWGQG